MQNLVVVFDDQHARQHDLPVAIYLDIRSGQLTVGYLTGQATAKRHNLVLQWPLPQDITSAAIKTLIKTHIDLFEQVLDNAYLVNNDRKQTGSFDTKAKAARAKLDAIFGTYPASKYRLCCDLYAWLNGALYNDDYTDIDSFADFILSHDGDDNCYFSGLFNDPITMSQEILLLWQEDFQQGNDIPSYAIKALEEHSMDLQTPAQPIVGNLYFANDDGSTFGLCDQYVVNDKRAVRLVEIEKNDVLIITPLHGISAGTEYVCSLDELKEFSIN